MKLSLLDHLICPADGAPLSLEITEIEADEVKTGSLRSHSGRIYPIKYGVPRFVEDDAYAGTFSRQRQRVRQHFATYRREFDERATADLFVKSTGFDLSRVDGLTLDAGCGYGRFLRVIGGAGGTVVGVDLSADSVELAFDFIGRHKNIHIVQADLTRLPFPRCHFRRVFSIGVLHHTPDTRTSFLALVPHLEGGGKIAIWVYAPEKKVASNAWRKLTTKLPLDVVYGWCIANEALFAWLRSLRLGGGRFAAILPGGSLDTPFWQRVMSDYDDLTPCYAHTHTRTEVVEWFTASGLVEIKALPRATSISGSRPASGASRL